MDRIPFGVSRLDSMIGGGAPAGSVVLLASDLGAGGREFLYTSAAVNGLAKEDEDLFELYYGGLQPEATEPEGIHYVSFTGDGSELTTEMAVTMDEELVEAGVRPVEFADFSPEYFNMSKVPREWYAQRTESIRSLGSTDRDRGDVLASLGDYLTANGANSLVLLDSINDLVSTPDEEVDWTDITLLMKGLKKASHRWGGLVLLLANREGMTDKELGMLMEATDGTLAFEWETGGSERDRTMVVQQFRGVLSRLEDESIIRFETDIHDGGFDISDVRKIR